MSDSEKPEAAGELAEEQLANVSGGAGIVPEAELTEAPTTQASGLPTGKRQHKPFVITQE